jgi:hypothetical protein
MMSVSTTPFAPDMSTIVTKQKASSIEISKFFIYILIHRVKIEPHF